jgi:hypothetical protein
MLMIHRPHAQSTQLSDGSVTKPPKAAANAPFAANLKIY